MPQGISCSAPGGGHFQDSPPDRMECSQSLRSPRRWERGVGHLAKWGSPGGGLESQHGGHMGIPKIGGVPNTVGGGWRTSPRLNTEWFCLRWRGSAPLHRGRRGTTGLHPCQGAPVVERGLRRITPPQQRDVPNRGSTKRRHMSELLAPASCAIS